MAQIQGTNDMHLADLFEPTELEKQYSKLESKAERHGKRVVIWVRCPACGTVGETQTNAWCGNRFIDVSFAQGAYTFFNMIQLSKTDLISKIHVLPA